MHPDLGAYRFGGFLFDPASGELKDDKTGNVTARLQPQVAALLTALLEQPGTVVSRADLRARLWPDTTVDFDDSLNFCVRQLRLALRDEAGAPRFIETLTRRGYRFIAPVSAVTDTPSPAPPTRPARGRAARILLAVVVMATAVLMVGRMTRASDSMTRPDAVLALLPFRFDATDSTMVAYQRRLFDQLNAGVRAGRSAELVADTSAATHVLSGALTRRGFSVEVFVQLVRRPGRRHLWADSILDSYPFSGNSTLTADRIAQSVTRLLQADTAIVVRP
jgi:DNA-binding winged helix-turn-helix (wHTH) protein